MTSDDLTDVGFVAWREPFASIDSPTDNVRQPRSFAFGPFLLQPERQLLLRGNVPVRIGGRAFDILGILVEHAGQIVGKRELIDLVWPSIFVDDSNLKTNVATLRNVLGDRHAEPLYIATIIGRGYRFVCPVRTSEDGSAR